MGNEVTVVHLDINSRVPRGWCPARGRFDAYGGSLLPGSGSFSPPDTSTAATGRTQLPGGCKEACSALDSTARAGDVTGSGKRSNAEAGSDLLKEVPLRRRRSLRRVATGVCAEETSRIFAAAIPATRRYEVWWAGPDVGLEPRVQRVSWVAGPGLSARRCGGVDWQSHI